MRSRASKRNLLSANVVERWPLGNENGAKLVVNGALDLNSLIFKKIKLAGVSATRNHTCLSSWTTFLVLFS